jgi:hypothetical protein
MCARRRAPPARGWGRASGPCGSAPRRRRFGRRRTGCGRRTRARGSRAASARCAGRVFGADRRARRRGEASRERVVAPAEHLPARHPGRFEVEIAEIVDVVLRQTAARHRAEILVVLVECDLGLPLRLRVLPQLDGGVLAELEVVEPARRLRLAGASDRVLGGFPRCEVGVARLVPQA